MPQTQSKHHGQTWSTFEGIWITIHERWNYHWYNITDKNVHRHRRLGTCITETLSNHHETLSIGKRWDQEATYSQRNQRKQIKLVSTHHSCTKGRQRKMFSHWLLSPQQSNKEVYLAYALSGRHLLSIKWHKVFLHIGPLSRIPPHSFRRRIHPQDCLHLTIQKVWIY